jgi:single-stranded-DNA-specific exonuclease
MRGAHELFLAYGGHHASGGFSIKEECVHDVSVRLNEAHAQLATSIDNTPLSHLIDAELSLEDVTPSFARSLARFAPFGEGNPKPLFVFKQVTPLRIEIFGKQKAHTKLVLSAGRGTVSAILFFKTPEECGLDLRERVPLDVIAHIEESTFGGRLETRLRVVALSRGAGGDEW